MGPGSGTAGIACQSDVGGVITTRGGFSNAYARPSWQTSAVDNYSALYTPRLISGTALLLGVIPTSL